MKEFSLKETKIIKGIAICMMLVHHLFYSLQDIEKCNLLLLRPTQLETLAQMCKVCVAIYVFLSGYGLYKSFSGHLSDDLSIKKTVHFTFRHIMKLLTGYWWCVIPFGIFGMATGMRSFGAVYGSGKTSVFYFIIDFFGLGGRFDLNHMYNVTCWYIALALGLYILFPFLFYILKKSIVLFCGCSLLLSFLPLPPLLLENRIWIYSFSLGMIFAHKGLLDKLMNISKSFYTLSGTSFALIGAAFLRLKYHMIVDGVFAVAIIAFIVVLFSYLPAIFGTVFGFLGKYSPYIFMTHTFFFSYFWGNIIYYPKYPALVFALLMAVCLVYAVVLNFIRNTLSSGIGKILKLERKVK